MSQDPWFQMARQRRRLGLTQVQLAAGIASQSAISQLEQGRFTPSEDMIRSLAERLQLDANALIGAWSAQREQGNLEYQLWSATRDGALTRLTTLLRTCEAALPAFEFTFYRAFAAAAEHDLALSERLLTEAWFTTAALTQTEVTSLKLGKSQLRRTLAGFDSEEQSAQPESVFNLTSHWPAKHRCLVVDAWTRAQISSGCRRYAAAAYWRGRAESRLAEAIARGVHV